MMRLTLDYSDFGVDSIVDSESVIVEKLEKKLEDEFCNWDIDMAFDWDTLQLDHVNGYIEIGFSEFN
jgi:hypothetical protein